MERHTEAGADQLGDAACGPEVGGEAVGCCLLGQPEPDLLVLLGGQQPRPSGSRLGGQAGVALGTVPGHPLGDRDGMNTEGLGNGGLRLPVQDPLNGQAPNRFQRGCRSFASHAAEDRRLQLTWIAFLTCDSVVDRHDRSDGPREGEAPAEPGAPGSAGASPSRRPGSDMSPAEPLLQPVVHRFAHERA